MCNALTACASLPCRQAADSALAAFWRSQGVGVVADIEACGSAAFPNEGRRRGAPTADMQPSVGGAAGKQPAPHEPVSPGVVSRVSAGGPASIGNGWSITRSTGSATSAPAQRTRAAGKAGKRRLMAASLLHPGHTTTACPVEAALTWLSPAKGSVMVDDHPGQSRRCKEPSP